MYDLKQWIGVGLQEHVAKYETATQEGYAVLTFTQYGHATAPLYAAVMIKRARNPEQRPFWALSQAQFQIVVDKQASEGWSPLVIAAHGPADAALFSGVFEKRKPVGVTALGLVMSTKTVTGLTTIQGRNAHALTKGLRPVCIASYGEEDSRRFAGVWDDNTGADAVLWNNDGLLDSADTLGQRIAAQESNWCRPVFLTLNKRVEFCSIYEASDAGKFHVTPAIPGPGFPLDYADWVTVQGFLPICIQAAGEDVFSSTFSAIYVEKDKVRPRMWSATGTEPGTQISANVRGAMTGSIIRQAAVAIVYKKRLVYARGFNMAEEGWPEAEPTTHFRLASCSKTITALAALQLIEEGKMSLDDSMQEILHLKTPDGHGPKDPQFSQIKIRHLLEHSSGLPTDTFESLSELQKAFENAGKTVSLPVSAEDRDSFIATLPVSSPGNHFVYSNCGYYLLGRVVNKLRGTSRPIDAYQKHLFDPLKITRIRRAKSLIADQEAGEARYQDPDLRVYSSVFPGQKLVPTYYGTYHLEIMDGDGGLTGAAVDVARLIAVLTSQQDSPVLKWHTIVKYFTRGVQLTAEGHRAGYGFDALYVGADGKFSGLKGGALDDAHSAIDIDGDWGSVSVFAAADAPNAGNSSPDSGFLNVYAPEPDRDSLKGVADLFPHFGMPSL
ncbi:MAG TPA: serine hydrolase [Bryocella sp.]|nr:serine hydrolase [Bryocella sp.]